MTLSTKLPVWQQDLLDLSRANPLLYFKIAGRGAGIAMRETAAADLYATLLKRASTTITLDWVERTEDPDTLERQLTRLRARTGEDMRDRGLQTLYLAFGLLDWRESADSAERILTPVVLLPVTLGRKGPFGVFTLSRASDDDPEINPVLREKMRSDYNVAVPMFEALQERIATEYEVDQSRVAVEKTNLARILQQVTAALPPEMEPRMREETHLGRFSFQKLVMYDDLRKHEPQIYAHTLLRAIGGENVAIPQPSRLIDAGEIDTQVTPGQIMEILEADSSQQEAILAAKAGANFVLQGPPGTGKSQTIANVIAECLGQGEKVLFVSEKMAALEVVWKRLREAGLDEFLLNLHDPRQRRDGFLKNLAAALRSTDDAAEPIRAWDTNSLGLQQERDELNTYVRELHAPRFDLRISAFDAYAELAKRHDAPRYDFQLADARSIGERQLTSMRRLLDDLGEHLDILDRYNEHPWRDTLLTRHEITQESAIQAHFSRLFDTLGVIASDGARLRAAVEPPITPARDSQPSGAPTPDQARRNAIVAELALAAPFPPMRPWLNEARATELLGVAAHAQERSDAYHAETAAVAQVYQRSLYDIDLESARAGLTTVCSQAVGSLAHDPRQSPHDIAITERQRIATLLDESAHALDELLEAGRAVATDLDLPAPTNSQDAFQLSGLANHVLATPRPPRAWLHTDDFARVAVLATDASEHARSARTLRETLSAIYRLDLFALDVVTLEERFRNQYRSIVRRLGGQYRADARTVRSYMRPEAQTVKRASAELASDLGMAKRVFADEGWLRERRTDLADALGRLYDVSNPDWDRIQAAVTWTQGFHQGFARIAPQAEPAETLAQLVSSGGPALESLRAHAAALVVALEHWPTCANPLQTTMNISKLTPPMGATVYTAPMESLLYSVRTVVDGLRALWSAVDTLAAHRLAAQPVEESSRWSDLVQQVEVARHVVAAERWLREQSALYRESFGETFTGFTTDWDHLLEGLRWSQSLAHMYEGGEVPPALAQRVADDADPAAGDELKRLTDSVTTGLAALDEELAYFATVLPLAALRDAERTIPTTPVDTLTERVRTLLAALPDLERLLASRRRIEDCRQAGLGSLLDVALAHKPFPRDITRIFEHRFYASWLDAARAESRELAHFSGERHDMTIARYRRLDQEHIELTKQRLRVRLLRRRAQALRAAEGVRESPQGKGLTRLRQIVAQKRPRGSIRQIVRSVAPVLIDLKPCWMMSPMSVSQFVEESAPIFDVVVFDEASQVRPEDAICAILRGRRLIVVGDSKQLPPTQFFAKEHRDDDEDDDAEAVLEGGRRESILEECRATGMRERSLLWHYRSRHESLIAFSNHHFYDDKLITFPNPGDVHADGVRFEYVEDGLYEFGASRTNQPEAERVVDLIYEHLHRRPELSLGVVALSAAQQDAIQNALELRRKRDPESEAFADLLDEDRPEGVFVKNLESVQGDERDVIILSVGYGRAGDGRIRFNFGPVNRSGGARRLNVAVTRAREQTILVSSLRALDIPATLASEGVQVLRSYLDYAERGIAALHDTQPDADDTIFDSPFEEAVYDALIRKGLRLATQVGCSGYRIDLAVRNPDVAGRFLLGIECDGRSYHSSKTARDRDRLRQSHLEKMGWTILRIWSSEWRRDPEAQVERVLSRLRELREGVVTPPAPPTRTASNVRPETSEEAPPHGTRPDSPPPPAPPTRPTSQPTRTSGVQRAAAAAAEQTRVRQHNYAPPGVEPGLLHPVATWAGGEFVCESCVYFTKLRPGRFTCSKLQRTQAQALIGWTPCCSWWQVK